MKFTANIPAPKFNAITADRAPFIFSSLQGKKILLFFYSSAFSEKDKQHFTALKKHSREFISTGIEVVCVFQAFPKKIFPFTGRVQSPFVVLADPMSLLYDMYSVVFNDEAFQYAPAFFYIDEDMMIRKAEFAKNPDELFSMDQIIEQLNISYHIPEAVQQYAELY